MFAGLSAALGAGLLWGLVFLTPLVLHDYPGFMLAVGRSIPVENGFWQGAKQV